MKSFIKQRGIGIVEIMLVIAVSAVIIIMGVRYYQVTSESQKQAEAIRMVGDILEASRTYAKRRDFSSSSLTIPTLIDAGLLTKRYETSPWGDPVSINVTQNDADTMRIRMDMPYASCDAIIDKLLSTRTSSDKYTSSSKCVKKSGFASVEIYYSLF